MSLGAEIRDYSRDTLGVYLSVLEIDRKKHYKLFKKQKEAGAAIGDWDKTYNVLKNDVIPAMVRTHTVETVQRLQPELGGASRTTAMNFGR